MFMSQYDFLIVGAGFFGATMARKLTNAGKKCIVIDKLPHIAGTAYDEKWDDIIVAKYGAHILHTKSKEIWDFLSNFSKINNFINKPKVISNNKVYSFPINMMTLHQLWGVITPEEARQKILSVRIPCEHPRNLEEWILDQVGPELYELFIYGYTKKQWMKEPRELPSSIIQRLPIRLTYDENYFATEYQGIPAEGYTKLVENMLDGIDVKLDTDFFKLGDWQDLANHLIYSGPIDKFFNYEFGELEYNTLRFEYKKFQGDFQGNAVFNHVDINVPYLRSIEHKHFYKSHPKHDTLIVDRHQPTIVSYDFPVPYKEHPEPYYPIRDERNSAIYDKYKKLINSQKKLTVGGRLGSYSYFDIDQVIGQAMRIAEKLI